MKVYVVYEQVFDLWYMASNQDLLKIVGVYSTKVKAEEHAKIITYQSHYDSNHVGHVEELDLDSINLDELKYKVQFQIKNVGDERSKPWYGGE